jgi:hypothetical protein
LREKNPQSILWIDSSPLGGGAENEVQRNHPSILRIATLFVKEGCGAGRRIRLTSSVNAAHCQLPQSGKPACGYAKNEVIAESLGSAALRA